MEEEKYKEQKQDPEGVSINKEDDAKPDPVHVRSSSTPDEDFQADDNMSHTGSERKRPNPFKVTNQSDSGKIIV